VTHPTQRIHHCRIFGHLFLDLATSRFDGRSCTFGYSEPPYGNGSLEVPGQNDLHAFDRFVDQTCLFQCAEIDYFIAKLLQFIKSDLSRVTTHDGLKTDLGQPTLQRHLTAFETDFVVTTCAGFLALMATTAGLTQATADTPTDTFPVTLSA
jgi:hypothetical protein